VRLPFLQVTQETWENARSLAALLSISEGDAFKLICDLWRWGISLGPADEAPTGICESPRAARLLAAAVGWTRDPEELAIALLDLGLIERTGDRIRVRGTKRYAAAWEKARKDRERKKSRGLPSEVARNSVGTPGESQGQTQTQTQTHKKQHPSARAREVVAYDEPLIERMARAFQAARGGTYKPTPGDEVAMGNLLRLADGDEAEILRRWVMALKRTRYPLCASLVELNKFWPHYAADEPKAAGPPDKRGPQAVAKDWTQEQAGEVKL
jgi:hypothetical protein